MAIGQFLAKIFGTRNDRLIKRYRRIVTLINDLEPTISEMTDAQLGARTHELRSEIVHGKTSVRDVLPEAMAIIRESMDRHIGIRNVFNPEFNFDPEKEFPEKKDVLFDEAFNAFADIEDRIIAGQVDWTKVEIPVVIYKAIRKLYPESRPPFRARCFDVQLIGGLVLSEGKIAEMKTGEGKTFVAPLACFLKVLEGKHAHVITVNDYLVKRDAVWTKPAFENLGISVGFIQSELDPGGEQRRKAYTCDITYGTNSEFGFDYLRDNMRERLDLQVQGPLDYAIIDEVDSILIDEARTPLIISGPAHDNAPRYRAADEVARKVIELHRPCGEIEKKILQAKRDVKAAEGDIDKAQSKEARAAAQKRVTDGKERLEKLEIEKSKLTAYYEVEYDRKSVHLTHEGIAAAQEFAGVGSFYVGDNLDWPHLMEQALRAHVVYERDKEYVIEPNPRSNQMEVVIVDEYTGRKMVGRQWSDGLHQAVEAKERVPIKTESQTMATITLQNFFKLYGTIAGMTGTAQTEAEEFQKIYKLEVVTIPTNRPVVRGDHEDRVYRTEPEKWDTILEEIKSHHDAGRPVLVGTTSVEKSERLSALLQKKHGIKHEVLNARQHEREAQIVALAGQQHKGPTGELVGNVTIATNMAGRGTDIKPVPESFFEVVSIKREGKARTYVLKQRGTGREVEVPEDSNAAEVFDLHDGSKLVGGLHVIGTERHTSRRIDNQLRGRSGRQGDAGSSRFYCSLDDDLLKMFMPEWTVNVFKRIGMQYGEAIESGMLTKSIEKAQKKVEERNFLARKNLLEYDEVMDVQRSEFYGMRQRVLEGREVDQVVWKMIGDSIRDAVDKYVTQDFVAANIAEWARQEFDTGFEPGDFKGLKRVNDLEETIKNLARNDVATTLPATLGEYMGEDPNDNRQWAYKNLIDWARNKYRIELTESQLRKMDGKQLEDLLLENAMRLIDDRDCSVLEKFLEPHYGLDALCDWAEDKFGVDVAPSELIVDAERSLYKDADQIVQIIDERARKVYREREIRFPIDQVMTGVFGEATTSDDPYRAEYLRNYVRAKFGIEWPMAEVQGQPIEALRERLYALQTQAVGDAWIGAEADKLVAGNADATEISQRWAKRFGIKVEPRHFDPATARTLKGRSEAEDIDADHDVDARDLVIARIRQVVRHELTQLEQYVLISIFDQSWKDHLYAMDVLKGSIGLQGFAERDPRIAFKREGFRYFSEMMISIRDKVTDIIFRVDVGRGQQPKGRDRLQNTQATHEVSQSYDVGENARETSSEVEVAEAPGTKAGPAKSTPMKRDVPKVGRNEACPCGSGKKYKKCCGQTAVN